jgi:hypothetical protein
VTGGRVDRSKRRNVLDCRPTWRSGLAPKFESGNADDVYASSLGLASSANARPAQSRSVPTSAATAMSPDPVFVTPLRTIIGLENSALPNTGIRASVLDFGL